MVILDDFCRVIRSFLGDMMGEDKTYGPVPLILEKYRNDISDAIKDEITDTKLFVYDMLRYCLGWGDVKGNPIEGEMGKSLRPSLCMFACECAGRSPERVLNAAASIELIHNFSLIHDEIQDLDETRHHRPTLWTVWGKPKALIAGDVLRVIADMAILDENQVDGYKSLEGMAMLTEACLEMIEGQYMDIYFESKPYIMLDEYMSMISRKTGALIRCSLSIGSLLGGMNKRGVSSFREAGQALGYTFQIRDDILGIWGDSELTGKPVGADIRRKKKSLPILHAISESTGVSNRTLLDIFTKDAIGEFDVETVLTIMDETKTYMYSQDLACEYRDNALDALRPTPLDSVQRDRFSELVYFLAQRKF